MTLRRALIFTAAAFLLSAAGRAQSGWTIDRCVAAARERNLLLPLARNNLRASEASGRELAMGSLPQIKVGSALVYAPRFGRFGYDPAITDGGSITGQVMLRQSLYDGGVRSAKVEQSGVESAERSAEIRRAERDISLSVRQGCILLLFLQRQSELQREGARQLDEYLALVRRLAGGGAAGSTDILKTEIQLATARTALAKTEQAAASALVTLKETMGLPVDSTFALAGTIEDFAPAADDSSDIDGRNAGGMELDLSDLEISRASYDIELARRETNPVVAFFADAGLVTSGDNLNLPREAREPMIGFSLGLSVEVPLFSWGASDLRIEQKQIVVENLRMEKERLRRAVEARAARLRLERREARGRLLAARRMIGSAEDNFLLTKSKYAAGAALSMEVLAALQTVTESRLAEAQALADFGDILARIEHLYAR